MASFYMPLGMMNLQGWRGRTENAGDRLEGKRYSGRERKSRSVTTSKRSLPAAVGGRGAEPAHRQQLTPGTHTKA